MKSLSSGCTLLGLVVLFLCGCDSACLIAIQTAPDGAAGDRLGQAVATNADFFVAGAREANVDGKEAQGAVYVYQRDGEQFIFVQKLVANDGKASDRFGTSVAIDGDRIVVGATGGDIDGQENEGAAYVFFLKETTWVQEQKLTADDGAAGDIFGKAVAIRDDAIVVGAEGANLGSPSDDVAIVGVGAAYVFERQVNNWDQQQKLTAADPQGLALFGFAIALGEETIVVGAPGADTFAGAVYVFGRLAGNWVQHQKLVAFDGVAFDTFGASVALQDGNLVIGSPLADAPDALGQGAVYVYVFGNDGWSLGRKQRPPGNAPHDQFGESVALAGDIFVVGAPFTDLGGNADQGVVYVFDVDCLLIGPASELGEESFRDFLGTIEDQAANDSQVGAETGNAACRCAG